MVAKRYVYAAILAVVGLSLMFGASVRAAPAKLNGGITLSPFQQQIALGPDEAEKSFTVSLTNNTDGLQEIHLSARDFGSLDENGGVSLEGTNAYTQKYGLTSWMTIGIDTILLNPSETKTVPVTITNRTSLQPGGHYGAVVASVTGLNGEPDKRVTVNQQLISLVFANKTGGEHYDMKLDSVTYDGNWFSLPTKVKLRIQNPGNVHITPRGTVQLVSPGGTIMAQGIINSESAFVMPETYREIYVPLQSVGRAFPVPGRYKVVVDYRYEGLDRSASATYRLKFINAGMYVVALLFVGAIFYGWKRRFKRRR